MKKILTLTLALITCIGVVMGLVACDQLELHEHAYSDEWTSDEDFHWHACGEGICPSKDSREEHTFEENDDDPENPKNVCTVCGYEVAISVEPVPEHEHTFAEKYSSNDNFHWYACTYEGCTEKGSREEHYYATPEITQSADAIERKYVCQICDHEYTEVIEISSVVEGETSWDEAFDNLEFFNFSLTIKMKHGEMENVNQCEVTETGAHMNLGGYRETYTQRQEDGSYVTYVRYSYSSGDEDAKYIKLTDTSDSYYVGAKTEMVLHISFAESYDKFTYDEEQGAYVYDGVIEAVAYLSDGTPYRDTLKCFNNVVKVANGKISYISSDYYFNTDDSTEYHFTYYNIGYTDLSIPLSVIENAVDEEDIPKDDEEENSNGAASESGKGEYNEDVDDSMTQTPPADDEGAGSPDATVPNLPDNETEDKTDPEENDGSESKG